MLRSWALFCKATVILWQRQWCLHNAGGISFTNAFFGQGSGGIFLSNVGCNGNEDALISCSHSGIGVHTCRHQEDAGVQCLRKLDNELACKVLSLDTW